MFRWLLVLFIIVPVIEMWGLISVGRWIGGWQTISLILLSGLAGAFLAKREGRRIWGQARAELESGRVPAGAILDGLCVFTGGLLLLLPGFFTDLCGILLLLPFTRRVLKKGILIWLQRQLAKGNLTFFRRW